MILLTDGSAHFLSNTTDMLDDQTPRDSRRWTDDGQLLARLRRIDCFLLPLFKLRNGESAMCTPQRVFGVAACGILAVMLFVSGCGSGSGPSGTVKGKVTLKGEPVASGTIVFLGDG